MENASARSHIQGHSAMNVRLGTKPVRTVRVRLFALLIRRLALLSCATIMGNAYKIITHLDHLNVSALKTTKANSVTDAQTRNSPIQTVTQRISPLIFTAKIRSSPNLC